MRPEAAVASRQDLGADLEAEAEATPPTAVRSPNRWRQSRPETVAPAIAAHADER
jgi:hypothetical protein